MKVIGRIHKAALVRGRDTTELELRLVIEEGVFNPYLPTSVYQGGTAVVELIEEPQVEDPTKHKPQPGALRPSPEARARAGEEWAALAAERDQEPEPVSPAGDAAEDGRERDDAVSVGE